MTGKTLIQLKVIPRSLVAALDNRDVALCLLDDDDTPELASLLGMPWRLVLSETDPQGVLAALEGAAGSDGPMTRRRGFVHVVESDPSRIDLPTRSLPIYLLNGRDGAASGGHLAILRRVTMIEELRRSLVRELVVVSGACKTIPDWLGDLWADGFRASLTFVSTHPDAPKAVQSWLDGTTGVVTAGLLVQESAKFATSIKDAYASIYPDDRNVARIRGASGRVNEIDLTSVDDPERPLLDSYSLIEVRHLKPLLPNELSEQDFVGFFQNPESSWRPYAAGLPWMRDQTIAASLGRALKALDSGGPEENCIAYIACEAGAGGTTLARALAWEFASQGYPTLVARSLPFSPDALPVANFMHRALAAIRSAEVEQSMIAEPGEGAAAPYEPPWLLVFDIVHWQSRDDDLRAFRNELERSGRRACILLVTGPQLGLNFYRPEFRSIAELNHSISISEAVALGGHLNRFLGVYGRKRSDTQWMAFYEEHTVRYLEGFAAFWVTLSFWIQGHYDLTESIQEWMYRCFKAFEADLALRLAILQIAALSSERLTIPEALLPRSEGPWPLGQLLDDARATLAPLGLVRVSKEDRWWGLVHDVLGRLLVNAVFYDFAMRERLGFGEARDAEHLRFMILSQVARNPLVAERRYRAFGESFATSIFKIDPDHGRGSFAPFWRDALSALDGMPPALRNGSRLFRHHMAISRRRVATLNSDFYAVTDADRLALLERAVEDINHALNVVDESDTSETTLNLYNSLANAYHDLAEVEIRRGAAEGRLIELRRLANDATRRAFQENPNNSYVVETYIKNLLQGAGSGDGDPVEKSIEALGILFSALTTSESAHRAVQLQKYGERALNLLLQQSGVGLAEREPSTPLDVLVRAWSCMNRHPWSGDDPSDIPSEVRRAALSELAHPVGRGNLQVIRLTYQLVCAEHPYDFQQQLRLAEELNASLARIDPQLRLEYAILLFQNGRAREGDQIFRGLRRLWHESEFFVFIPGRLKWMWAADRKTHHTVQAVTGSEHATRAMALVHEFGNTAVPFRPEEFGFRGLRPGLRFAAHVSFGHNGPFLRPVTAGGA